MLTPRRSELVHEDPESVRSDKRMRGLQLWNDAVCSHSWKSCSSGLLHHELNYDEEQSNTTHLSHD